MAPCDKRYIKAKRKYLQDSTKGDPICFNVTSQYIFFISDSYRGGCRGSILLNFMNASRKYYVHEKDIHRVAVILYGKVRHCFQCFHHRKQISKNSSVDTSLRRYRDIRHECDKCGRHKGTSDVSLRSTQCCTTPCTRVSVDEQDPCPQLTHDHSLFFNCQT